MPSLSTFPLLNSSLNMAQSSDKEPDTVDQLVSKSHENLGQIRVERPLYCQDDVNRASCYHQPRYNFGDGLKNIRHTCSAWRTLSTLLPILKWLPRYEVKENLCSDIVAGLTVAIIHIPQGLAYAFLANVPPIIGLYMAFYPVLIYVIFGTSRHISMGTFAVTCLMTGKAVLTYSDHIYFAENGNIPLTIADNANIGYSPTQVAVAVTAVCGIYQLLMFTCRMGVISMFLSATLISGFTTGAAIHVASTQVPQIFGLSLKRHVGLFKIVKIVNEFANEIGNVNVMAMSISAVCIVLLVFNTQVLRPAIAKRTRLDLPVELMIMLVTTWISYQFGLKDTHGIKLVDHIPVGLPQIEAPKWEVMRLVFVDALAIAIVSYAITVSMALIYANKHGYDIDGNQELLATGAGNIFGSFFSCCPVTASLSRTSIQESVGGKTQVVSIVSCTAIVFILLWIGPIFETLPRCVLASIILVALKGMLLQVKMFTKYWNLSKVDGVIWLTTFLTVVLVDIDIGLAVGITLSVIVLLVKGMTPYACTLGILPKTELYFDTKRHNKVREINHVKIFRYNGGLSFAQCDRFKRSLIEQTGVNVNKVALLRKKELRRRTMEHDERAQEHSESSAATVTITAQTIINGSHNNGISYFDRGTNVKFCVLILDLCAVAYVDPAGIKLLHNVVNDFKSVDVHVLFAGVPDVIYEALKNFELHQEQHSIFLTFPTIHDAVMYAYRKLLNIKDIEWDDS